MGFDAGRLLKTLTAGHGSILIPHIDAYQSRGNFPPYWHIEIRNEKSNDGYFHPSSDCYKLPSQLYAEKKGLVREPIDALLRRTFDIGHMIHGYFQNILVDMEFVTPENVERHINHKILTPKGSCIGSGTGDLVDVQIPGQGSWLVDIKSMNKSMFEKGADEYTLKRWTAQIGCYMDWFNADKALILAVSKDSPHALREYQIQKDQSLLDSIYEVWVYTAQCLDTNTEPDDSPWLIVST